jgi:predicted nuclease of predicted toxin-antitoxin system
VTYPTIERFASSRRRCDSTPARCQLWTAHREISRGEIRIQYFERDRTRVGHLSDEEVVALAIREERGILTFDLDFGEIVHRREHGRFGAIVVRTRDQTVDVVNGLLESFFSTQAQTITLDRALVVIGERRIRVETVEQS